MKLAWIQNFDHFTAGKHCYLTHLGPRKGDRGIIRTGVDIDHEGTIDICESTAKTIADFIGWKPPEHSGIVEQMLANAEAEVTRLHKMIDDLASKAAIAASGGRVFDPLEVSEGNLGDKSRPRIPWSE